MQRQRHLPIDDFACLHPAKVGNAATLGQNLPLQPVHAANKFIATNTLLKSRSNVVIRKLTEGGTCIWTEDMLKYLRVHEESG